MTHGGRREGSGRPAKLTQEQAANLLIRFANGESYAALGREFNVTGQCISDTLAREKARQQAKFAEKYKQEAVTR